MRWLNREYPTKKWKNNLARSTQMKRIIVEKIKMKE